MIVNSFYAFELESIVIIINGKLSGLPQELFQRFSNI